MEAANPPLPLGYWPVPPGHVVNAVTYLQMTARPPARPERPPNGAIGLWPLGPPDPDRYRAFFRAVGEDWLWSSRLAMPDGELRATLEDPQVDVEILRRDGDFIGLLELDFRQPEECELAYFGLVKEAIGQGLGRYLMNRAIAKAWAKPIRRFWVHTCTFDHPGALGFYQASGFRPYAFAVEVMPDPRLTGHLPRSAAPHVPLISGA
jgi:GNAT superfamily N-acetyltransferase